MARQWPWTVGYHRWWSVPLRYRHSTFAKIRQNDKPSKPSRSIISFLSFLLFFLEKFALNFIFFEIYNRSNILNRILVKGKKEHLIIQYFLRLNSSKLEGTIPEQREGTSTGKSYDLIRWKEINIGRIFKIY